MLHKNVAGKFNSERGFWCESNITFMEITTKVHESYKYEIKKKMLRVHGNLWRSATPVLALLVDGIG